MQTPNQCQHVESGACSHCTNFRSAESIKKHEKDRPFAILGLMLETVDGEVRFKRDAFSSPMRIKYHH